MSSKEAVVQALNAVQAWELTGFIQYTQHGLLVTGPMREVYRDFFKDLAEEASDHMRQVGDKIVSLGGVPTVEPNTIRQETELTAMLKADLELEQTALETYMAAHAAAEAWGHKPTLFWLEERISEEQIHVDEFVKLTQTDASVSRALGAQRTA